MKKVYTNSKCNVTRNVTQNSNSIVYSVRIPKFVKEYFDENGLKSSQILIDFYYHIRENQIEKLQEEIQECEICVTNKRIKVTQLMSEVTQNQEICNTLFDVFKKQNRDINNLTQQDRFWIKSQLDNNNIKNMTVTSFIDYCKQKKEG